MLLLLAGSREACAADVLTIGPSISSAQTLLPQEVDLPELRWGVAASRDPFGTSVEFSCGPFVHAQQPQYTADCRLNLRLVQARQSSGWGVLVSSDQTRAGRRAKPARVAAASHRPGSALLGLRATFIPPPEVPLCAGEYVTRVVGLVSGL